MSGNICHREFCNGKEKEEPPSPQKKRLMDGVKRSMMNHGLTEQDTRDRDM
jgi:hypothetical protein